MFDNFLTLLGSKCSIGLSKGFSIFNYCFSIFGKEVCLLNITWYSLSYIIGLIIGLYYIKYILNRTKNKLISKNFIKRENTKSSWAGKLDNNYKYVININSLKNILLPYII